MNIARWFALGFVALVLVCAGGFMVVREEVPAARGGFMPPVCRNVLPRTLARGASAELDLPVQRIVARGSETVLLAAHTWMVAIDGQILGPFGNAQRGAPGYLADPQDAVITDTAIFILDVGGHAIRVFSKTGSFERSIELPRSPSVITQPRQLFVVNNETFITALRFGTVAPEWALLHLTGRPARFEPLHVTPGSSINGIVVDYTDSVASIGEMSSYRITTLSAGSSQSTIVARAGVPLHPFSAKERRRYRSYWSQLPPNTRSAFDLPAYVPPLVGLKRIARPGYAVLVTQDVDNVHVEILDNDASPVCRMTGTAIERPVALGESGFYFVAEEAEELVLEFAEYPNAADD